MFNFQNIEGFEWDKGNVDKNFKKHAVTNSEAEQVFFNQPLIVNEDSLHTTEKEKRYVAFGKTDSDRFLVNIFTVRKNNIRVISSRDMSKKERIIYNEKAEENT